MYHEMNTAAQKWLEKYVREYPEDIVEAANRVFDESEMEHDESRIIKIAELCEQVRGKELEYIFTKEHTGVDMTVLAFVADANVDIGITIHAYVSPEFRQEFNIHESYDDYPIKCTHRGYHYALRRKFNKSYIDELDRCLTMIIEKGICIDGESSNKEVSYNMLEVCAFSN